MADCVFCKNLPRVMENDLAYALFDINPLSKGHALIIFKRHFDNIFDATPQEFSSAQDLLGKMKNRVAEEHKPDAYNVWINCGKVAGQIVMHAHIHLIPRYAGEAIHIKEHLKGNIE